MSIADSINNVQRQIAALELLNEKYAEEGDYAKAYGYFKRYQELNNALFEDKIEASIKAFNSELEVGRKNQEVQLLKLQVLNDQYLLIFLSIITLLIAILAYFFYTKIRDRKRSEKMIFERNEELRVLNDKLDKIVKQRTEELSKINEQLKESNEELDNFVYKAAHDLRGPVARIQGIINLLELEGGKEESNQIRLLKEESADMLLILKKLDSVHEINQHELNLEPTDLLKELQDILDRFAYDFSPLTIELDVDRDLQWPVDRFLFKLIIINLIEHSYSLKNDDGAWLRLSTSVSETYLRLVGSHNGKGIPDDVGEEVFDMFYQGPTNSSRTGLALYTVKKAVERLSGEIRLVSHANPTEFEIKLSK